MTRAYFKPRFLIERERFIRDMESVATKGDWLEKWPLWMADRADWPMRSPRQLAELSRQRADPLVIDGVAFGYTTFAYDIEPEARYLFFWALKTIGNPLLYPHVYEKDGFKPDDWQLHCRYDEIWTAWSPDLEVCPRCKRPLIREFVAD